MAFMKARQYLEIQSIQIETLEGAHNISDETLLNKISSLEVVKTLDELDLFLRFIEHKVNDTMFKKAEVESFISLVIDLSKSLYTTPSRLAFLKELPPEDFLTLLHPIIHSLNKREWSEVDFLFNVMIPKDLSAQGRAIDIALKADRLNKSVLSALDYKTLLTEESMLLASIIRLVSSVGVSAAPDLLGEFIYQGC